MISLEGARRVAGGDINAAYEVRTGDGRRVFVKTRPDVPPGEYAAEAAGLRWLAEAGGLPVPAVVEVRDDLLALEWVEPGGRYDDEALGRGLAVVHAAGADAFGGPHPMRLGRLTLPNDPAADWPAFYAERRLLAVLPACGLSSAGRRAVERVAGRMADLAGPAESPARLHGDLWGGNVLAGADGRPWLIDPAAHGGHREVDLAMLRLFGGPSERCFAAYDEASPLAEGWEERIGLWQLFGLLVHAALVGGAYVGSAERTARRYAG